MLGHLGQSERVPLDSEHLYEVRPLRGVYRPHLLSFFCGALGFEFGYLFSELLVLQTECFNVGALPLDG